MAKGDAPMRRPDAAAAAAARELDRRAAMVAAMLVSVGGKDDIAAAICHLVEPVHLAVKSIT